jgi:protein-L-isoaspartate(D-aspartate) O-methyltransferase
MAPKVRPPQQRVLRPQRPLHEAANDAARQHPSAGLGLDSAAVRARMVTRVRADGVRCEPVLAALGQVPRHMFVDTALATQAYEDTSLPIGLEQTISKPSVVARMLALLADRPSARGRTYTPLECVLEIGSGCGYQAALLSLLAVRVVSIERLRPLHDKARANLSMVGADNVCLVYGDGRHGHVPNAPYDGILAAAGGDDLPAAWFEQLAIGGRLVAPMHSPTDGGQMLLVIDRSADGYRRSVHDAVHFVPLKSGVD